MRFTSTFRLLTICALLLMALVPQLRAQTPAVPDEVYLDILRQQAPDAFTAFQRAMAGQALRFDPSLTKKGGPITLQIDEQIKAPATTTDAEWRALLAKSWTPTMQKIAKRLSAGGYTLLGLPEGAPDTFVQATFDGARGPAFRLRLTRSSVLTGRRLTVHVDVLAGK